MARFVSNLGFDYREFAFRQVDDNITWGLTATDQDLWGEAGDFYWGFEGVGFDYELTPVGYYVRYDFTAGVVNRYFDGAHDIGSMSISELEADAVDFTAVMRTVHNDDDIAMLAELLSGDDLGEFSEENANEFAPSNPSDYFDGFAGNDTINGGRGDDFLFGNVGDDILRGGSGSDFLHGGAGADHMAGGYQDDTYIVDNVGDVVVEISTGGALDTVASSITHTLGAGVHVEKLRAATIASKSPIDLTGNGIAQQIIGNNGDNLINGKAGSDTLTGNLGQDSFVFDTWLRASNVDTITDFSVVDDSFRLDDAIFSALALGELASSAFKDLTVAAKDVSDRILVSKSGSLYYDADGTGDIAAVQFAKI